MRILITGGAGYIGSHAIRALVRHGHDAVIYDNLSTGNAFVTEGHKFVQGDIRDREKLMAALHETDAVMHFAALSYVGESSANPRKYFENNIQGGITLLGAVLESGVPYFIHSSSCAVYGIPGHVPINEDAPRNSISPYGVSKLAMEHILEAYGNAYGLRYVNLRYFNAAGADEGGGIGELHQPETHLIPLALEVAAGIRNHLDIYWTDYPTPDGTCIRDYVHVNDLVDAHILALDYLAAGGASTAVNLGTEKGYSVLEVLSMIEEVTQRRPNRRICGRRSGDPAVLIANIQRARDLLNWSPRRSLNDIIASAWKWMEIRGRAIR